MLGVGHVSETMAKYGRGADIIEAALSQTDERYCRQGLSPGALLVDSAIRCCAIQLMDCPDQSHVFFTIQFDDILHIFADVRSADKQSDWLPCAYWSTVLLLPHPTPA